MVYVPGVNIKKACQYGSLMIASGVLCWGVYRFFLLPSHELSMAKIAFQNLENDIICFKKRLSAERFTYSHYRVSGEIRALETRLTTLSSQVLDRDESLKLEKLFPDPSLKNSKFLSIQGMFAIVDRLLNELSEQEKLLSIYQSIDSINMHLGKDEAILEALKREKKTLAEEQVLFADPQGFLIPKEEANLLGALLKIVQKLNVWPQKSMLNWQLKNKLVFKLHELVKKEQNQEDPSNRPISTFLIEDFHRLLQQAHTKSTTDGTDRRFEDVDTGYSLDNFADSFDLSSDLLEEYSSDSTDDQKIQKVLSVYQKDDSLGHFAFILAFQHWLYDEFQIKLPIALLKESTVCVQQEIAMMSLSAYQIPKEGLFDHLYVEPAVLQQDNTFKKVSLQEPEQGYRLLYPEFFLDKEGVFRRYSPLKLVLE